MTILTIIAVIILASLMSVFIIDVVACYFAGKCYKDDVPYAFVGAVIMLLACFGYVLYNF